MSRNYRTQAANCGRSCFWRCDFFVCVWNISGTAERICAKFAGNTCLIPHSETHGRVWMSRSKIKGQGQQGQKNGVSADISEIAELICAKFTRKTCLVPHSDEFEGQGQIRRPAWKKHLCSSLECIFWHRQETMLERGMALQWCSLWWKGCMMTHLSVIVHVLCEHNL